MHLSMSILEGILGQEILCYIAIFRWQSFDPLPCTRHAFVRVSSAKKEGGMMNVKNAALLALTGTSLLTLVLLVHLVLDGWVFFNGVVVVMRLGASLIRAFAAASLAVFFWTFQRARA